jgi:hypothetical protein
MKEPFSEFNFAFHHSYVFPEFSLAFFFFTRIDRCKVEEVTKNVHRPSSA